MFADDMALVYSSKTLQSLKEDMENDLELLYNWLSANKLVMNVSKTKFILFHSRRETDFNIDQFSVFLNSRKLERVTEYKYLGLIIDEKLTYESHLQKIRNKITPISFALKRIQNLVNEDCRWMIFNAHVMSHFLYLLPIWGATGITTRMKEMSTLQNRCVKYVRGLHWRFSTKQLYNSKNLPILVLTQFQTILLVFKIKHDLMRHNLCLQRASEIHSYGTRNRNNFYIHFTSTTRGQKCVLSYGLTLFNGLPPDIRDELCISMFKNRLRDYLYAQWLASP